jgi:hypothetical protein
MAVIRDDVELVSHGAVLRGWLFRPEGAEGPTPGIVMAHGLSATREMFLDDYAAAFAAAGFTTLAYDHFGFGASDGEPRQWPSPSVQHEGYRDAIAWLAGQPGIDPDRIGIWGSSFSGGHVIVLAAEDLPIRCAVAQVPFLGEGGAELPAAALAAVVEAITQGRDDVTIPVVTADPDGLGFIYEDDGAAWFTRVAAERAPTWRNELRVSSLAEPFRPIDHLPAARVPLLLVTAAADRLTPPGPAAPVAATTPNVEIAEIPGGHFDAYVDGFSASSGAAIAWYRRHLGS